MVVGIGRVRLLLPEAHSLKEKRAVLRRIKDRVRARFNVAVAEVGGNDLWQSSAIGFAVVANERHFAADMIDQITRLIADGDYRVAGEEREIVEYDDGQLDSSGEVAHWEPEEPSPMDRAPAARAAIGAARRRPRIPVRRPRR